MNPLTLTPEEIRVLGSLIEKAHVTPEYYPMTLNSLVNACNQKSSREPVVNYSEAEVIAAINLLREKGLCSAVSGNGRVVKYMHRADLVLGLSRAQLTALSLILLRGPQTYGEIRTRSGRQYDFPSLEAVGETIASMMNGEKQLVEEAPRRIGQKEARYRHRFFLYDDSRPNEEVVISSPSVRDEIEVLKTQFDELKEQHTIIEEKYASLLAEIDQLKGDLYGKVETSE